MSSVYWIHHKDHTDMFGEGYIGVSNNVNKRWNKHKNSIENVHLVNAIVKYGWNNLIKKVILFGDENYCLSIEAKMRPNKNIGWNIAIGGGKPPSPLGKKRTPEHCANLTGKKNGMFGKKHSPEIIAKMTGTKNGNYKGNIVAANILTGKQTIYQGKKAIVEAGFSPCHVYRCIIGKQETHKGYTFKRESN